MGKRHTKIIYTIVAAALLVAAAAVTLPNLVNLSTELDHQPYKEGFSLLPDEAFSETTEELVTLSNGRIRLEMDAATTHFTVTDLQTGKEYASVPGGSVTVTSDEDRVRSQSEVTILYYDSQSKSKYMGSGPHSVDAGNFRILRNETTIRVLYTFGTPGDAYFVPAAFEKEFFENDILPKITSATDLRRIKRYYRLFDPAVRNESFAEMLPQFPSIEDRPLYVFTEGADKKDVMKDITSYMEKAGYTAEQYALDSANFILAEGGSTLPTGFFIPVEYELTETGFKARVLSSRIEEYKSSDTIATVSLLEYFDASDGEVPMTYFVPDGSGALIRTTKENGLAYSQQLFGSDEAIFESKRSAMAQSARLPVFGSYGDGKGYMAIIEGGAAQAVVKAKTKGTAAPMNTLSCDFNIRGMMSTDIGTDRNIPVINLYSKHILYDYPVINYMMLDSYQQDYSGMASLYKDYLISNGTLEPETLSDDVPVYLDFTCLITKKTRILGVSYNKRIILSDFAGISEVVRQLHGEGIDNLRIRLKGLSDDGLANSFSSRFEVSRLLGGKEELEDLIALVDSKGGRVYLEGSFSQVYRDGFADPFNSKSDAVYHLDRTLARTGVYDSVTMEYNGRILPGFLVSPALYEEEMIAYLADAADYFGNGSRVGLSWADAGHRLFSDFNRKKDMDRSMTAKNTVAALARASEVSAGLMADGGNSYMLRHATDILSAPFGNSLFQIETAAVPFYQLVLSGRIHYAGSAFNRSSDTAKTLLRSIEYGGGLYFDWIVNDDSALKSTDYETGSYSLNYKDSMASLIEMNKILRIVHASIDGAEAVRHDILADDVTVMSYSNGVRVVVNRSDADYSYEGTVIGQHDFTVIGGAADEAEG
ncbi:MAG: DUF5696 domain-containing protein [Saccharofermentanales bacterium]